MVTIVMDVKIDCFPDITRPVIDPNKELAGDIDKCEAFGAIALIPVSFSDKDLEYLDEKGIRDIPSYIPVFSGQECDAPVTLVRKMVNGKIMNAEHLNKYAKPINFVYTFKELTVVAHHWSYDLIRDLYGDDFIYPINNA